MHGQLVCGWVSATMHTSPVVGCMGLQRAVSGCVAQGRHAQRAPWLAQGAAAEHAVPAARAGGLPGQHRHGPPGQGDEQCNLHHLKCAPAAQTCRSITSMCRNSVMEPPGGTYSNQHASTLYCSPSGFQRPSGFMSPSLLSTTWFRWCNMNSWATEYAAEYKCACMAQMVGMRACYLFSRLAKTLRAALRPLLPDVLQRLQPHLAAIVAHPLPDTSSLAKGAQGAQYSID